MGFFDVNVTVTISEVEVEADTEEEAKQIVVDDAKTRFGETVIVTVHTC